MLTGVLFALAPVVRGASVSALAALNSGARNAAQSGGRGARRTRAALVVSEVALAVMMLAGAGLFLRTLMNLRNTDLGFVTDGVLTARLSLPRPSYNGEKAAALVAALVDRARAMPGVTSAAAMAWTPIVDGGGNWGVEAEGAAPMAVGELPRAAPQQVTPGFFSTMAIPLLRGRDFSNGDRATSEPVVIVNETLARRFWGTDEVLGRKLRMATNGMPWITVVGVARDTRVVGSSIARHRFTTLLLGGLAAFALMLAAIGIYGVVSYGVAQRRYELGVRMALGAGKRRVLSLVVGEGLGVTVAGLAIGTVGVVVLGRVLASMLVGVGNVDLTTLVAVSALLIVVAVVAVVVPARRATSIDPMEALRRG